MHEKHNDLSYAYQPGLVSISYRATVITANLDLALHNPGDRKTCVYNDFHLLPSVVKAELYEQLLAIMLQDNTHVLFPLVRFCGCGLERGLTLYRRGAWDINSNVPGLNIQSERDTCPLLGRSSMQ